MTPQHPNRKRWELEFIETVNVLKIKLAKEQTVIYFWLGFDLWKRFHKCKGLIVILILQINIINLLKKT